MADQKNKTGQSVSVRQQSTPQSATATAVSPINELHLEAFGLHQANQLSDLPSGANAQILRQTAVMGMQGRLGNQQVQRMIAQQNKAGNHHTAVALRPPTIQTKLSVNEPDDAFEKEADQVADVVMSQPMAAPPPPMPTPPNAPANQAQRASQTPSTPEVTPQIEQNISQMQQGGQPLSGEDQAFFGSRMGADLSNVRVHTDAAAVQTSRDLNAKAFTVNNHIAFNQGEYAPQSQDGRHLLAHELTHTLQQGAVSRSIQRKEESSSEESGDEPTAEEKAKALAAAERAKKIATQARTTGLNEVKKSETQETQAEVAGQPPKQKVVASLAQGPVQDGVEKKRQTTVAQNAKAAQTEKKTKHAQAEAKAQTAVQEGQAVAKTGAPEEEMGGVPMGGGTDGSGLETATAAAQTAVSTAFMASKNPSDKAPTEPTQDPGYRTVAKTTQTTAEKEQTHGSAQGEADEAQAAAVSPPTELKSQAESAKVGQMEQAETPAFDSAGFKARLMQRIQELTPKTAEDADNFKENDVAGSLKGEMQGEVKTEQDKSQAPLEKATEAAPDATAATPKSVTPLTPNDPGVAPVNPEAQKAAPKPKGQGEFETPVQESSQAMDQQMTDAGITEEQLEKSNEPAFLGAVKAKKEAETSAQKAPKAYRQFEKTQVSKAEGEAKTAAQQQLAAMHGERSTVLGEVNQEQGQTKTEDEQKRDQVAKDIETIYTETQTSVGNILSGLDGDVTKIFDEGATAAKKAFEDYVDAKMDAYTEERYGGWLGWAAWLEDKVLGMPSEVNAFFSEGRQLYLDKMDAVIDHVVAVVSTTLAKAKAEVANGKKRIQVYINDLPEDLRECGQQAAQDVQSKFDELEQDINSKQDELINTLAQKYQENLQAIDARIEEMKEANKGLVEKVIDAVGDVIKTIIELKNMLLQVLASAAEAVTMILNDPIGFLSNLLTAVKQGFDNFVAHIGVHLEKGLMAWLTGALGGAGITMPESFDAAGIFSLVTQVLGLTWGNIRARAVTTFGEPVVGALETGFELFTIIKDQGLAGLWTYIQDQIGNIKDMVLEEIKQMLVTEVIEAGVQWLLGMLGGPAGAFIKAAKAIYDVVMWFVNNGKQVLTLVQSIIDSIKAIAQGSLGQAAQFIEQSLANALPVVIGFLASLLGLGDISTKVRNIIEKIQAPINKAIDWVLGKAKAVAQRIGRALGIGKDDEADKKKEQGQGEKGDGVVGDTVAFNAEGEGHKLWINVQGKDVTVMVASSPSPVNAKIEEWEKRLKPNSPNPLPPDHVVEATSKIEDAKTHMMLTEKDATVAATALTTPAVTTSTTTTTTTTSGGGNAFNQADEETEKAEQKLADILRRLFTLFGDDVGMKYDLAIVGAGSAAAYHITSAGLQNGGGKKGVIIGGDDPWAGERGKDDNGTLIGHPESLTTPNGAPAAGAGYTDYRKPSLHAADVKAVIDGTGYARLKAKVTRVDKRGNAVLITTDQGIVMADEAVVATGAGPIRKPDGLSGDDKHSAQGFKHIASLDEFENEDKGVARDVAVLGGNAGVTAVNRAKQRGYRVVYWFNRGRVSDESKRQEEINKAFGFAFYPGTPNKLAHAEFDSAGTDKKNVRDYKGASVVGDKVNITFGNDGQSPASLTVDQFVYSVGPDSQKEGGIVNVLGDATRIRQILKPVYATQEIPSNDLIIVGFQSLDKVLTVIGAAAFRVAQFVDHDKSIADGKVKDLHNCMQEVANIVNTLPPSVVSPEQLTAIASATRALNGYKPEAEGTVNYSVDSHGAISNYLQKHYRLNKTKADEIATKIIAKRTEGRNDYNAANPHGIKNNDIRTILTDAGVDPDIDS